MQNKYIKIIQEDKINLLHKNQNFAYILSYPMNLNSSFPIKKTYFQYIKSNEQSLKNIISPISLEGKCLIADDLNLQNQNNKYTSEICNKKQSNRQVQEKNSGFSQKRENPLQKKKELGQNRINNCIVLKVILCIILGLIVIKLIIFDLLLKLDEFKMNKEEMNRKEQQWLQNKNIKQQLNKIINSHELLIIEQIKSEKLQQQYQIEYKIDEKIKVNNIRQNQQNKNEYYKQNKQNKSNIQNKNIQIQEKIKNKSQQIKQKIKNKIYKIKQYISIQQNQQNQQNKNIQNIKENQTQQNIHKLSNINKSQNLIQQNSKISQNTIQTKINKTQYILNSNITQFKQISNSIHSLQIKNNLSIQTNSQSNYINQTRNSLNYSNSQNTHSISHLYSTSNSNNLNSNSNLPLNQTNYLSNSKNLFSYNSPSLSTNLSSPTNSDLLNLSKPQNNSQTKQTSISINTSFSEEILNNVQFEKCRQYIWQVQSIYGNLYNFQVQSHTFKLNSNVSDFAERIFSKIVKQKFIQAVDSLQLIHRVGPQGNISVQDNPCQNSQKTNQKLKQTIEKQFHRLNQTYQIDLYHKNQLSFCIVTNSFNNAKNGLFYRNIDSILQQNYSNYHVVYTDDASTDDTGQIVRKYIQQKGVIKDKFKIKINKQNKGMMQNIYKAITEDCQLGEIVVMLDGDDSFIGTNVLSFLNAVYQKQRLALMWNNFLQIQLNKQTVMGFSRDYLNFQKDKYTFRAKGIFISTHLKSFYVDLFRKIKVDDLKQYSGRFYGGASDTAMMMPMIQMCHPRCKYVPQIVYEYRVDTQFLGMIKNRQAQKRALDKLSVSKVYEKIQDFSFIEDSINKANNKNYH